MSALTPPGSGNQSALLTANHMSMTADTTADSLEESVFETEDEFDKSVAAMDLDVSVAEPIACTDSTEPQE